MPLIRVICEHYNVFPAKSLGGGSGDVRLVCHMFGFEVMLFGKGSSFCTIKD